MSQTFAENKIDAEENKNECCICYNDNSKEGKLIECCPNKHILCIGCFHESCKINCECPLCHDLYRPEIMIDIKSFVYYGAKFAQLELKYKKKIEELELRKNQVIQAKMRKQRQEQLERLQVRKTEQIQIIQQQNDELMRQITINNAKIENINKLELDEYNAIYPEPREILPILPVLTPASEPQPAKIKVTRIQISGKSYLKTTNNLLYDPETKEEVGIWDPDTKTIKPLPEEEEEYDSN